MPVCQERGLELCCLGASTSGWRWCCVRVCVFPYPQCLSRLHDCISTRIPQKLLPELGEGGVIRIWFRAFSCEYMWEHIRHRPPASMQPRAQSVFRTRSSKPCPALRSPNDCKHHSYSNHCPPACFNTHTTHTHITYTHHG